MHTLRASLLVAIAAIAIGGSARAEAPPTLAYRVTDPPTIDGRLDDAVWESLPMRTGFVYNREPGTYAANPYQSEIRVGWDDKALYIGLKGIEPRIADHLRHAKTKDTGKVNWKYQLFEILIDPATPNGRDHYQFAMDILGHQFGTKAGPDEPGTDIKQIPWDEIPVAWQGAVHCGSDFFSMEFAFPFAVLGGPPKPNASWGFEVGRHGAWEMPGVNWQLAGQTVLTGMPSAFWRNWREHGELLFVPEALLADYQNVGKKTEAINAAYFTWRAAQEAEQARVGNLLALMKGKTDLLRALKVPVEAMGLEPVAAHDQAKIMAFGVPRQPTPEDPPPQWNRNWWTNNDGTPRTIICTWSTPVTLNMQHIDWLGSDSYATEYSLEYWTDGGWQLAYEEAHNTQPESCHLFPAITTQKLRFTITGMKTRDYYLSIQKFEFYKVDAPAKGGAE